MKPKGWMIGLTIGLSIGIIFSLLMNFALAKMNITGFSIIISFFTTIGTAIGYLISQMKEFRKKI